MTSKRSLRILRVIASVDPRQGGPVEGLRRSAQALAEMGHSTEVVTLDAPGAPYLAAFPVPVHAQGRLIRPYGYTPAVARWIRGNAERFDVAVVHGLWNHASIGGRQGLVAAGIPYLVFTHGMMDLWFRTAFPVKHLAKQAFWTLFQGRVLADADAVLFTTEEERDRSRNTYAGHRYTERVVAYAAAEPTGEPEAEAAAFRALLPALAGRRYLLFLSRIHPKKGCDLLVQAFGAIAAGAPDLDLVIAGPDEVGMIPELQRMAQSAGGGDRVHFPGMLSGDAKWGAFRGAEAFVLPSHQENFGIVVAEALACGCPVLISDKVNIWREIVDSESGFVGSDTVEGTVEVLTRFLRLTEAERAALRLKARAAYVARYGIRRAAEDLEAALLSALRSSAA